MKGSVLGGSVLDDWGGGTPSYWVSKLGQPKNGQR